MENRISTIILIGIFSFLISKCLYLAFLQPYRNRLMVWYMKRFSPDYRSCSKLFDSLIAKHRELSKQHVAVADGYYAFLEVMQADSRFRSSNQVEEAVFGRVADTIDSEMLIMKSSIPIREFEQFVYFSGSGYKWHKVVVSFDFSDGIHLQQIWFFYHEEDFQKYYFELKKKRFPPDLNGKAKRKESPILGPLGAKKIPIPESIL